MSTPLPRSTPEAEGVDSSAILALIYALEVARLETHSLMILRHGKVIAEGWWQPYAPDLPHSLFSLSKSFTSTAIGLAVDEGRLTLDDKVISFFPDDLPAEVSPNLAAMEVRHLLSMCTGHAVEPTGYMIQEAETWVKGFFDLPIVAAPGSHFLYNTGATYMLAAILARVTGETLVEYLRPRLFDPLGIENPLWEMSPQGINTGGFGLSITTEDIARFGQLYLQKGLWEGKQIVPEAWVQEATSKQIENGNPATKSDWGQGYGYQFWRCQPSGAYRGDGAFGQYCIVLTEQEMVIAMTSAIAEMQPTLDLIWKHLLPAIHSSTVVRAPSVHAELLSTLGQRALPPVPGECASALSADISGARWRLDENPIGLESVGLDSAEKGAILYLKSARGEERIGIGFGEWTEGSTTTYSGPPLYAENRTRSSGAWVSPDTFRALIRLVETPFVFTATLRFVEDTVVFSNRINVSLAPVDFPELTGTRVEDRKR